MAAGEPEVWSPITEWAYRFRKMVLSFFYSSITPWFFLGMATEALGIAVQDLFGMSSYPVLDFLIGVIIGMFLMYYQKKYPTTEKFYGEDHATDESEDPVDAR
jgi:hypothetical protein